MRSSVLAIGALVAALALTPGVRANGDPASDVLLASKIYFPTAPAPVSPSEAERLRKVVASANARGYPIRVALIGGADDLGLVPELLNQPQKYAEFLGPEIRFVYKGDLLVVMPNGLGLTTTDQTPPPRKAIAGVKVEPGGSPDGLARTAGKAVAALSTAAGHPVSAPARGRSATMVAAVIAGVLAFAAAVAGALWVRRRRARIAEPAQTDLVAASDSDIRPRQPRDAWMRLALVASIALLLLTVALFAAALRERAALPTAAERFLQATTAASVVTSCLTAAASQLPADGRANAQAIQAASVRLQSCDLHSLEYALSRVKLPFAPPITNDSRRRARKALEEGIRRLRAIAVDTREATRAMSAGGRDGVAALRRAARASSPAYTSAHAKALEALEALGKCSPPGVGATSTPSCPD